MRDLSDNVYLKKYSYWLYDMSLNSFMFGEHVLARHADRKLFDDVVRNLITALGFNIKYTGHRYLTILAQHYLLKSDYSQDEAVSYAARKYDVSEESVRANLQEVVTLHDDFHCVATYMLGYTVEKVTEVSVAVEIIGALFKIFYDLYVDDETFADEENTVFNVDRLIAYGKNRHH